MLVRDAMSMMMIIILSLFRPYIHAICTTL